MKEIKSQQVGEFRVVLYDLGFGYQVRTLFSDGSLFESQLAKSNIELGSHNFDMTCAVLRQQLRV